MSDTHSDTEENIRTRAYLLWESCSHKTQTMEDYWYQARERIEAEAKVAYPPVQAQRRP